MVSSQGSINDPDHIVAVTANSQEGSEDAIPDVEVVQCEEEKKEVSILKVESSSVSTFNTLSEEQLDLLGDKNNLGHELLESLKSQKSGRVIMLRSSSQWN